MNPLTNMKNITKLSEQELQRNFKSSWHDQYKDSAWIFVGGLPYDLTEGDIICVFSQYGEIVNINLVRDKDTGKQKGFCFICYEDQRSTVLAVDNLNGIKILGRAIRVDHVNEYKVPKESKNLDPETRKLYDEGCAPGANVEKKPEMPIPSTELPAFAREEEAPPDGFRLPPRLPIGPIKQEENTPNKKVKVKKEKKHKKEKKYKKKKSKKHKKKHSSDESSSEGDSESEPATSSEEEEEKETKTKFKSDSKSTKRQEEDTDEMESKRPRLSASEVNPSKSEYKALAEEETSKEPRRHSHDRNKDVRKHDRQEEDKYNYEKRDKRRYEEKHDKGYRKYDGDSRYRKYGNDRNGDKKNEDRYDDRRKNNERNDDKKSYDRYDDKRRGDDRNDDKRRNDDRKDRERYRR